jgi:hypothetical protein
VAERIDLDGLRVAAGWPDGRGRYDRGRARLRCLVRRERARRGARTPAARGVGLDELARARVAVAPRLVVPHRDVPRGCAACGAPVAKPATRCRGCRRGRR